MPLVGEIGEDTDVYQLSCAARDEYVLAKFSQSWFLRMREEEEAVQGVMRADGGLSQMRWEVIPRLGFPTEVAPHAGPNSIQLSGADAAPR